MTDSRARHGGRPSASQVGSTEPSSEFMAGGQWPTVRLWVRDVVHSMGLQGDAAIARPVRSRARLKLVDSPLNLDISDSAANAAPWESRFPCVWRQALRCPLSLAVHRHPWATDRRKPRGCARSDQMRPSKPPGAAWSRPRRHPSMSRSGWESPVGPAGLAVSSRCTR